MDAETQRAIDRSAKKVRSEFAAAMATMEAKVDAICDPAPAPDLSAIEKKLAEHDTAHRGHSAAIASIEASAGQSAGFAATTSAEGLVDEVKAICSAMADTETKARKAIDDTVESLKRQLASVKENAEGGVEAARKEVDDRLMQLSLDLTSRVKSVEDVAKGAVDHVTSLSNSLSERQDDLKK